MRTDSSAFVDATQETLRLLAVGFSTGGLDVRDGGVSGTVYLNRGRVTFVECSRTPDLGTRLVQSGSITESGWRSLVGRSTAEGVGLEVVARDARVPPDLLAVLRSTVLDAAAALVPGSGRATCRYLPGRRHWAGGLVRWEVEDLLTLLSGLEGSDAAPLRDDDVPVLGPVPDGASVILRTDDWPLLDRIDGRTTVAALAWRHGLQLAGVRAAVRRLRTAGVCGTDSPNPRSMSRSAPSSPPSQSPPSPWSSTSRTAPDHAVPTPAAVPALRETAPRHAREPAQPPAWPPRAGGRALAHRQRREPEPPPRVASRTNQSAPTRDPAFLLRVLEGLRRMD